MAVLYLVMMAGVGGVRVVVDRQVKLTESKMEELKAEIQAQAELESGYILVKSKLSRLMEIRKGQTNLGELLGVIRGFLPEGVRLTEVKTGVKGEIEVSGRSFSPVGGSGGLADMGDVDRGGKWFKEVRLSNMSRGAGGEYGFTLVLVRKEGG